MLLYIFFILLSLCIPGDAIVDVTDEEAIDSSQFFSSTDAAASSGMRITTLYS